MPRKDQAAPLCECGNRAQSHSRPCVSCEYLDGDRPVHREIIAAFRQLGCMAHVRELQALTGIHKDSVQRGLRELVKKGRVKFVDYEVVVDDLDISITGKRSDTRAYYDLVSR